MKIRRELWVIGAALLALSGSYTRGAEPAKTPAAPAETKESEGPLQNMKFRNLGPAVGGGRVAAVAGIAGDPNVIYVCAAAVGVWKTVDGGNSWKAVF